MQYKYTPNQFGAEALTPMQERMRREALKASHIVLLSPTGTGKTLAYLLPLAELVQKDDDSLQAVVIVPTRELAIQSDDVLRRAGTGIRSMCLYGGRPAMEEHRTMREVKPQVVFATPGRMNDHLNKENLSAAAVTTLVVDEFDKCVELGFQEEMERVLSHFPLLPHLWLTSATDAEAIPQFINRVGGKFAKDWQRIDFLAEKTDVEKRMELFAVHAPVKDKLETLGRLLTCLKGRPAIVFVAYRESVERVGKYLRSEGFFAEMYHGGMEQEWRERALYKFRSGSANVLVSTDLAARGLDIPEVEAVVHYHLPLKEEDFTHRSGRTARWEADGTIYLIIGPEEHLPEFALEAKDMAPETDRIVPYKPKYVTLYIGRGKKDKLSKSDVLGFLCKKGNARAADIGRIDVGPHHAYVAILRSRSKEILQHVASEKIKGMKTLIEEMRH